MSNVCPNCLRRSDEQPSVSCPAPDWHDRYHQNKITRNSPFMIVLEVTKQELRDLAQACSDTQTLIKHAATTPGDREYLMGLQHRLELLGAMLWKRCEEHNATDRIV